MMCVKSTVFSSKSERTNYYKLSRTWGDQYRIYHNLPFLNIFEYEKLDNLIDWRSIQPLKLTNTEKAWLKKTSVDYTLCDANDDRPILCIEFDGMQQGFNVGTSYYPNSPYWDHLGPDEWRQKILELKLKVAFDSFFPFFVVSSVEFGDLSPEIKLTLVDGIIGEVLATRSAQERSTQFDPAELGCTQEEFDALMPWERDELIQDWVLVVEVETRLEHDPIDRHRWSMQDDFMSYTVKYLSDPDIDMAAPLPSTVSVLEISPDVMRARIEAFNAMQRIGVEIILHTDDCGDVSAIAWVPNFKSVGFLGYSLAEDIAYILAMEKLQKRRCTNS